ncbi:MAG: GAF domain-containing protein [Anaerolineae bacterium]|nr:GAF domain-containing protein [Anaerolineae bacterium]
MKPSLERPIILFIEPPGDDEEIRLALTQRFNLTVETLQANVDIGPTVQALNPDLVVIDVDRTRTAPEAILSVFTAQALTVPVMLIGTAGEMSTVDVSYPYLVGWLRRPFLASSLVDAAAMAIQTARLYHDTQQYSRDLKRVNDISRLVSDTLDVAEIPRRLVQRTADILNAERGALALIDRQREGVVFQLACDAQGREVKGLTNFIMPLGEGIIGLVAKTGQPVIANDVQYHLAWSPLVDQMTGFTTRSLIAVPLITEGETIGVIEVVNKKEGDFEQADVDLLVLVASSAASAIRNARQYETVQRANEALREAQEKRIAAERWAVLGKAAANLAHRINNTTTLIPIAAQHTQELLEPVTMPPQLRADIEGNLDRIRRNALYTVELAMVLLRRFRTQPTEVYDVNALIRRAVDLIEVPSNIKLITHLDPNLSSANTSDLLIDVLIELITNAIKALTPQGGLLRIASFVAGHQKVAIQITDNGPGIAAEAIDKIFDIFYTTSPAGLGFGLWWVKTFLEQQGSDITVESLPHEQTTFTIILPQNLS